MTTNFRQSYVPIVVFKISTYLQLPVKSYLATFMHRCLSRQVHFNNYQLSVLNTLHFRKFLRFLCLYPLQSLSEISKHYQFALGYTSFVSS